MPYLEDSRLKTSLIIQLRIQLDRRQGRLMTSPRLIMLVSLAMTFRRHKGTLILDKLLKDFSLYEIVNIDIMLAS